jgi:3-hydroxyisobutyrate dehydrogenase
MAEAPPSAKRDRIKAFTPALVDYTNDVVYGDLWERKALSKRDRSLITVAALVATYRPEHAGRNHRSHHPHGVLCGLACRDVGRSGRVHGAGRRRQGRMTMANEIVVGFVGLGTMGGKMATNILNAGYKLVVHDLHRQSASHHLQAGAEWADTPRALAEKSDVIFTSLPEPADVERVSLGADGLIEGVKKGAVYFDLSTNAQGTVKKIHEAFAARSAQMLDAPVSGGPSGAASRKMAIWVGGDKAAFEKHKAVLDAMGDRAAYIGPIGTATVAKLVHNMSGYAITCALAETFTMGVKAGMDPVALWEAVRQGVGGRRFTFDGLLDQFLPGKYDPPNFALKLATKDVALATALGRELGVPMRMCSLVYAEMTEACNRGWEERDSRSVMLLQQERAGVKIAADPERVKQAAERAKSG